MNNHIEVVPYNPEWPLMFEAEAKLIKQALGANCLAIHHMGSTSVPGLNAKPLIDIIPVVKNILEVNSASKAMEDLGYTVRGENGIAFRRFFSKGDPIRTHNVHVYEEGDHEISRCLKFRDWMRTHEEDAKAYAQLKMELAAKYPEDIFKYWIGKDVFIASIDAKTGHKGWRMVKALTDREWSTVHALRKQYALKLAESLPEISDHQDHIHFAFYYNSNVIGYAYLELLPELCAQLHVLVIEEKYHNQGFESVLLKLCERWLNHQGRTLKDIHKSES